MKKTVMLLLFVLVSLFSFAQIKIESVAESPMDITASTQKRLDLNNKPCALVKVEMRSPQATFQGNVVGEVAFNTGEYWVYVSPGTKILKMFHPDQSPIFIDFTKHGIESLKSERTYIVQVFVPSNIQVTDVAELNHQGYKAYEVKDYVTAYHIYQTAAAYNSPEAMFMLSMISDNDNDSNNDKEGENWLRRSAELGYPPAQYQLGAKYYSGDGVKRDENESFVWFEKSALQGFAPAMYNYGIFFEFGAGGVEVNYDAAEYWYCMAIDNGYNQAQEKLEDLRRKMVRPESKYQNFSLFCERCGRTYCYSPSVWNSMAETSKKYYEPVGIYMEIDDKPFVLYWKDDVREINYENAIEQYGDFLMTEEQAVFIKQNSKVLVANCKSFGIKDLEGCYWFVSTDSSKYQMLTFASDGLGAVILPTISDSKCAVRPVINLTR